MRRRFNRKDQTLAATKPARVPRERIARPPATRPAPVVREQAADSGDATPATIEVAIPQPRPVAAPEPREEAPDMSDTKPTLTPDEERALASVVAAAAVTIAKAEADSASALETLYKAGVGSIHFGGVAYAVRHTRSGWRAVPPSAPKARAQRRAVTV